MALDSENSGIGRFEIGGLTPRQVYLLAQWFGVGLLIAAGLSACGEAPEEEEPVLDRSLGQCSEISPDLRERLLQDLQPSTLTTLQTAFDGIAAVPGDDVLDIEPEFDVPAGLEVDSFRAKEIDKGGFTVTCFSVVFEEPVSQSLDDAIVGNPSGDVRNPRVIYRFACELGDMLGVFGEVDGQNGQLNARVFDQIGGERLEITIFLQSGDSAEGVFGFQLGTEPDDPKSVNADTARAFIGTILGLVECSLGVE